MYKDKAVIILMVIKRDYVFKKKHLHIYICMSDESPKIKDRDGKKASLIILTGQIGR